MSLWWWAFPNQSSLEGVGVSMATVFPLKPLKKKHRQCEALVSSSSLEKDEKPRERNLYVSQLVGEDYGHYMFHDPLLGQGESWAAMREGSDDRKDPPIAAWNDAFE
jgi:hypothetical protein